MKQQRSPDKPGAEGYTRVCVDCGEDMYWSWGGPITYFKCRGCERIEPCANVVIERSKGTVTTEDGNAKEVFAFRPEEFESVLKAALTGGTP